MKTKLEEGEICYSLDNQSLFYGLFYGLSPAARVALALRQILKKKKRSVEKLHVKV